MRMLRSKAERKMKLEKVYAKIKGAGKFLPEKVLTNDDLEKIVETNDEWITKRVGIKERRVTEKDVFTSDIAAFAAENALKNAEMTAEEIDLIIVATLSPDTYTPSVACIVQDKIGAVNATAFDMNAACTGFVFALTTAKQFIENGMFKKALVIGAECLTKLTNYKDRATCVLFGDGAGAVVLEASNEPGIMECMIKSDGSKGHNIIAPNLKVTQEDIERSLGGSPNTIWMDGSEVFKFAVRYMSASVMTVLENAGYTIDDVDLIVPHQANQRIIDGSKKRLGVSDEKMFSNIQKYGNMSSACIPIALCEAIEEGRLKQGELAVLVGMGGGLTWGAVLVRM